MGKLYCENMGTWRHYARVFPTCSPRVPSEREHETGGEMA